MRMRGESESFYPLLSAICVWTGFRECPDDGHVVIALRMLRMELSSVS